MGTLRNINMRSSTLHTCDGTGIMVPDKTFITSELVNWTKSDSLHRHVVTFSVPSDADTHRIADVGVKAAAKHPHILALPSDTACELKQFGEKGIVFAPVYWVIGPSSYSSEVDFMVWDTFKEAGIRLIPAK